jgi:hypothetical protein
MIGCLLVSLVESQLGAVEVLLGLPGEFCVVSGTRRGRRGSGGSGKGGDGGGGGGGGGGLFGGESGRVLFTALMQVEMERKEAAEGERAGLGVVEALRERMGRVRGLVLGGGGLEGYRTVDVGGLVMS